MVGNYPNFMKTDILRCFLKIDNNTSRRYLKKYLEIGEGTVKSILNILKNKKLISSTKKGHSLTEKGKLLKTKIEGIITVKKIDVRNLYPNYKKIGILIKDNKKIKIDYRLRDLAVKNGAEGALIFNYNNKLILPDYDKRDFKEIEKLFDLKNNNILVITFAPSFKLAEYSGLSVLLEINKNINDLLERLIN